MRKLLKRWYVWLGLVQLLGLAGSVALICSGRGRITQANFDRIQDGMVQSEVTQILGEDDGGEFAGGAVSLYWEIWHWNDGPNSITVHFNGNGHVTGKRIHLATVWETVTWYAKKGAKKIGVKWD
ncbi:MAG TPA: hypothetical protein VGY66_19240 [Gemmataceae bacterium]|jgi:hypothetical protein|nr:hypothetical protein [Gemmataceae bacterium]